MEGTDFDEGEFEFSRNYFLAKESGTSTKRSTHKLSDINIVDEQELREAVSNIEPKHEKEIASLIKSYKSLYSKWAFELRAGFGLLFYGFGPKKALIEGFASTTLTEYSVVVINGYLQSINLKQIIEENCAEQSNKDGYQLVRDCISGQIFYSTPVDFLLMIWVPISFFILLF